MRVSIAIFFISILTHFPVCQGAYCTAVYGWANSVPSSGNSAGYSRGLWGKALAEMDARSVYGESSTAHRSYGGYFEALNPNGHNVGLYASAGNGLFSNFAGVFDGNVVINGTAPASANAGNSAPGGLYALEVNGNAFTSAGGWYFASDRKIKKDITPLSNVLKKIIRLRPAEYSFKVEEFQSLWLPSGRHLGVLAQELEEVFPELVNEKSETTMVNSEGQEVQRPALKAVDYVGLIPVLIAGMQEQQQMIQKLRDEITELKSVAGNSFAAHSQKDIETEAVILSDKNTLILNQNAPNPFAESTEISYNIPDGFQKAQLIFRTSDGVTIKTADITKAGSGSFTIFADDLSNGSYTYILVVDGMVVASKTMIKQ